MDYISVINYFNERTGKRYRPDTYKEMILARYKEGYTFDDFKKVIENKIKDWGNNPKMKKYIRPETLFRKKHFDSYLNEDVIDVSEINRWASE